MGIKVVSKVAGFVFVSMLSFQTLDAKVINAVALLVDGEPVTLYEIEKVIHTFKVDRQKAIEILVDRNIEQNAIKSFGLTVSDSEIDDYMFRSAMGAKMSVFDFEKMLTSKGIDVDEYKTDLKEKIKKDKLLRSIIEQSYKEPTTKDLMDYYNTNINQYNIPSSIKVSRYDSKNPEELSKFIQTPLVLRDGVSMESLVLKKRS